MATPQPEFKLPAMSEVVDLPTIKSICEHYGLPALWAKIERDPPPLPFKSDGCTGWVNEWRGISIYSAGFLHDLKYWAGYPGEEVERLVADAELMIDVARLLNSTEMAWTMFHGVLLFRRIEQPRDIDHQLGHFGGIEQPRDIDHQLGVARLLNSTE